ncbi:MAG: hypothetical protein JWM10_397 [Myxococcaceae bacterium]|nr:hypothetical protein [Myxococcaceae bacterium]
MRRPWPAVFTLLALTALPSVGFSRSRWSLGVRAVGRSGEYTLGGVGGQIGVELSPLVSVELFTDHVTGSHRDSLRHEHEVGGVLRLHLLRGARWSVFPLVGACANLAVVHDARSREVSVTDVQFGARAGVGAEVVLPYGFSLGAEAMALAYLGHRVEWWNGSVYSADELSVTPMGQVVLHANYRF